MPRIGNPRKPLPPLATETNYTAADFQSFEFFGPGLFGEVATLRLHLKNGTTIDLPASGDALEYLRFVLCEAFPAATAAQVKMRGWHA